MVDLCKESTTTSSNHVKKRLPNEHISRRCKGVNGFKQSLCMPGKLSEVCIFNPKAKYDNRIAKFPRRLWRYVICIIGHLLCCYNTRLSNDDVMAIGVSYWGRKEYPNYARLHRGRADYQHHDQCVVFNIHYIFSHFETNYAQYCSQQCIQTRL